MTEISEMTTVIPSSAECRDSTRRTEEFAIIPAMSWSTEAVTITMSATAKERESARNRVSSPCECGK